VTGPLRDDLDYGRRQIGIGIDRQASQGMYPGADEHEDHERDKQRLA
jgi:hypothetical protein